MRTIIHLELLRIFRDKKYWFWACIGVPILMPVAMLILGFSMASLGTVEKKTVQPILAVHTDNEKMLAHLSEQGLTPQIFDSREEIDHALTHGKYSVALVDVIADPEKMVEATVLSIGDSKNLPLYQNTLDAVDGFAMKQRQSLIDSLDFSGPSFDVLLNPVTLKEVKLPDRLPPGLLQIVVLLWSALLLFPYLVLTWNGGSRLVTDRMGGFLSPINSSSLAPWRWLVARWLTLSAMASLLLLFSLGLFTLYMRAYGAAAGIMVNEGVLDNLSSGTAETASAYLVDLVAMWSETSFLSIFLWALLGIFQLSAACALVIFGSVRSASLAQYRIYELLPFMIVFVIPMIGLGALGTGIGTTSWIPGLNTVLSLEHVVSGGLPGVAFFASAAIALLTNVLLIVSFLGLAVLGLRNERLWAV